MAETSELMKRPLESDELTKKRMWELFMPAVKSYLGQDWDETEAPYIEKQILSVLYSGGDGYKMARDLENSYGWEEDRALVDLMDEGESALREAHRELVKQWIEVYGIAACRGIGDKVSTTHWHRKGQVGTISKIYNDEARYGVRFPDQSVSSHAILLYEEVIDAPEVPNADSTRRMDQPTGTPETS